METNELPGVSRFFVSLNLAPSGCETPLLAKAVAASSVHRVPFGEGGRGHQAASRTQLLPRPLEGGPGSAGARGAHGGRGDSTGKARKQESGEDGLSGLDGGQMRVGPRRGPQGRDGRGWKSGEVGGRAGQEHPESTRRERGRG